MAREDLQGQSGGGGIVDFDFTVTQAWFGPSERFTEVTGENTIFMHWIGTTDLENYPTLVEDGFHPSYNLGPDWEVVDGGASVKYVGGGKPRFGKWYGRLCDLVFELTEDVADTDQDPFAGEAHPSVATNWVGTRWHLDEKEYSFGSKLGKTTHLMPTEYLGKGTVEQVATVTPITTNAATTTGTTASNGLRAAVEALATSAGTYEEFQSAALAIPGVSQDIPLVMAIADRGDTGIYSQVNS